MSCLNNTQFGVKQAKVCQNKRPLHRNQGGAMLLCLGIILTLPSEF